LDHIWDEEDHLCDEGVGEDVRALMNP